MSSETIGGRRMSQFLHTNSQALVRYASPYNLYGLSWSTRLDDMRLAVSSFIQGEYKNKVQILELNAESKQLQMITEIDHPYPPTKIMWGPIQIHAASAVGHIATSADYLRIWDVTKGGISLNTVVSNKLQDTVAPLTALDWNESDPAIIGTSSIDMTCTIWDLNNTLAPKHQIIAHDSEVYDITFSDGPHVFGSVGRDGSLRVFDLRALDSCTVAYEGQEAKPLLRVAWNKLNPSYIAAVIAGSSHVLVLDLRNASCPIFELDQHCASVNSISWCKQSRHHLVSAAEDHSAIVYDLSGKTVVRSQEGRIARPGGECATLSTTRYGNYSFSGIQSHVLFNGVKPLNQIQWCPNRPDCIALSEDDAVYVVQI